LSADTVSELLSEPEDLGRWRRQVREFVEAHLPPELGRKVALGLKLQKDDYVRWQKILHRHGYFAGFWPVEHGGQGWDLLKQWVFAQECAICNAPLVIPYGVSMLGPVLYTFGSEAQRHEHLPGILTSDRWWCQGYSEPGAGSDLASLKTAAVRQADYYVVNGTKMWTTEAHWADWMHCLVRTETGSKPQQGITFLLIDMKSPGIAITPIVTIDGMHHTNQVFLDNVRVPVANRVGEEGQGWTIAKFLLGHERASIADTGPKLRLLRHLQTMHAAAEQQADPGQRALWRHKLADLQIRLLSLCALERRYLQEWAGGRKAAADASILKIRGTEILQALTEFALEVAGPMGAAHDPADLHRGPADQLTAAQHASLVAHEYLYGRCWSIFGGTNEVQRNIIARQILAP
jgi:alkylation response protein AidB-like acyl-CoA dehydrogenase